jgi:hypothetical protein
LLHIPIGPRIVTIARRFGDGILFEFSISFIALLVCIAAATAFWYWIERPALLASKKIWLELQQANGEGTSRLLKNSSLWRR